MNSGLQLAVAALPPRRRLAESGLGPRLLAAWERLASREGAPACTVD